MRAVALMILFMLITIPARAASSLLIVSPDGPYLTLQAALDDASDGDVIEVHGGTYPAPITIEHRISLIGYDQPVIDGGGQGSLVLINAPDVVFQGFRLRNTGSSLHHEDTAIVIQAPRVTISQNILEDVLFGIYFANAGDGMARDNVIHGLNLDEAMRGDGIRVWYSDNVLLTGNEVAGGRDTLIWYASNITLENNHFHHNRYGLHFMYSKDATITQNVIEENSIGIYLMYSSGLTMRGNAVNHNRGSSGYALALKDMDEIIIENNTFAGNRAGLYVDNSPSLYEGFNTFTGNLFAYNDTGVIMLPSVQRNRFQRNTFLENIQQAATLGRGSLQANDWNGNYWSDYTGFDEDGDGIGDIPYRLEKLFDSLTDTHSSLRLFVFSPAAQALDFAAAAFPALRPEPRFIDAAPLTTFQSQSQPPTPYLPLLLVSLLVTAFGIGIVLLGRKS